METRANLICSDVMWPQPTYPREKAQYTEKISREYVVCEATDHDYDKELHPSQPIPLPNINFMQSPASWIKSGCLTYHTLYKYMCVYFYVHTNLHACNTNAHVYIYIYCYKMGCKMNWSYSEQLIYIIYTVWHECIASWIYILLRC